MLSSILFSLQYWDVLDNLRSLKANFKIYNSTSVSQKVISEILPKNPEKIGKIEIFTLDNYTQIFDNYNVLVTQLQYYYFFEIPNEAFVIKQSNLAPNSLIFYTPLNLNTHDNPYIPENVFISLSGDIAIQTNYFASTWLL